jgi:hypothetical protein
MFKAVVNEFCSEGRQHAARGSREATARLNFITSELGILGNLLDVTGLKGNHSVVGVNFSASDRLVTLHAQTLYRRG